MKKCSMSFLPSSLVFMIFVTCNPNLFQQKRAERDAPFAVVRGKLAAQRFLGDSPIFPAAIEPFEPLSAESGACLVAENQIGFGYGGIPLFVPSLAHAEIAENFLSDVGFERNLDQRMEDFRSLPEARVLARNVEETELGKLLKQRDVVFDVMNEFGERRFAFLNVGERHHRGGVGKEHRELIHEVADGGFRARLAEIQFRGKEMRLDVE